MRLEQIIKKQDRKIQKKYKPVITGLPGGYSRREWYFRKHKDVGDC